MARTARSDPYNDRADAAGVYWRLTFQLGSRAAINRGGWEGKSGKPPVKTVSR